MGKVGAIDHQTAKTSASIEVAVHASSAALYHLFREIALDDKGQVPV
jgi:hypothetical protein